MIDRRTNPYDFNIEIDVPFTEDDERLPKLRKELLKIRDKYLGSAININTIIELKYDLERLLYNEEYDGVLITSNDFTEPETWTVTDLLNKYEQNYPDRIEIKKEYTNIEINNMLFDLHIKGVITDYDSPAVCYDIPSHNNKIFTGLINVETPIIRIGNKDMNKFFKELNIFTGGCCND